MADRFIPLHKNHAQSRGRLPRALRKMGRQFYLTTALRREAALAGGGIYISVREDGKLVRIQPAPNDDPVAIKMSDQGGFSCSALHDYTGDINGEWPARVIGGEAGEIHVYLEGGPDGA